MTEHDTGEPYADSLRFSLVAHWSFCPRRAWLEAMDEEAPKAVQIQQGVAGHARVDVPTTHEAQTMRGVDVRDPSLGAHGRVDRVERLPSGRLRVVDHKAAPVKRAARISDANRLQLVLQTMALESQGNTVEEDERLASIPLERVVAVVVSEGGVRRRMDQWSQAAEWRRTLPSVRGVGRRPSGHRSRARGGQGREPGHDPPAFRRHASCGQASSIGNAPG